MRLACLICFSTLLIACGSNQKVAISNTNKIEAAAVRYELYISFSTLEDVKRVPYKLPHLKMELLEEVSAIENLYRVSVLCKDFEIDGVVTKLNDETGINWAKRVE